MKTRCQQAVAYSLGRPLKEGEADAYTARILDGLRHDAQDRETWSRRTPGERLRAVGDRLMRETSDAALTAERTQTDALMQRREEVNAEIERIQSGAATDTQPETAVHFVNTGSEKVGVIRNPSTEDVRKMSEWGEGPVAHYFKDEAGHTYAWAAGSLGDNWEGHLHEIGAQLPGSPGSLQHGVISREAGRLVTEEGAALEDILGDQGRTYHQADGALPPTDFRPGSERAFSRGDATIFYKVESNSRRVDIQSVETWRGEPATRATLELFIAHADRQRVGLFWKPEAIQPPATALKRRAGLETPDAPMSNKTLTRLASSLGFIASAKEKGAYFRPPAELTQEVDRGTGESIVRGATRFHEDAEGRIVAATMRLTEAANFSTFLHESGHILLEIVREMATKEDAAPAVKEIWSDVMDWMGIDSDALPSTAQHEMFARTFEAYLREGRAPTLSLQRVFDVFRKWLTKIYETITLQHNLSPEITNAFDRMMASDRELADARAAAGQETSLFRNREESGMTEKEWESYQRRRGDAEAEARASLTATAMDAYYRQQTAWWNRQLASKRRAAARLVDTDPIRRAHDWIAYGKVRGDVERAGKTGDQLEPDWGFVDPPQGLQRMTLNLKAVEDDYGKAMLDALPPTVRPVDKARVDDLMATARRVKKAMSTRDLPRRLASFIVQYGGIRDEGGDALAILGSHRARPGLINNTNGKSLDDVAMAAWEAGYFGAKPKKQGVDEHYQQDREPERVVVYRGEPSEYSDAEPEALFFASKPEHANYYARGSAYAADRYGEGARVVRSVLNTDGFERIDLRGNAPTALQRVAWLKRAKEEGIPGFILENVLDQQITHDKSFRGRVETHRHTQYLVVDKDRLSARPPREYMQDIADGRPTTRQLLDALEADLRGEPVYKVDDLDEVWTRDADREWSYWFDQRGIDISADVKTLKKQLTDYIDREKKDPHAVHPDVIAHAFGFASGDEFLQKLTALEPRRQLIEESAQRMVRDEYGDPFQDGTMEEEATRAAHRALQSRVMELELEAIDRATNGNGRALSRAARKLAKQRIDGMTVRQIRGYQRILGQERKQAQLSMEAFQRGNLAEASIAKQAQLIAFHTYAEARDAAKQVDAAEAHFRQFDSPTTRKNIGPFHMAQIDQLLEQFELRRISLREENRRESLAAFVLRMQNQKMDRLLAIDPRRIADTQRRPFGQMTFNEVQGLRDTIKNLEHLGRLKNDLLIKRERARLQDVENEIVGTIEQGGPVDKFALKGFQPNPMEKANEARRAFHAEHTKMEFLFRLLDGLKDNGPTWRHLFRPIAEAEGAELEMGRMAAVRLEKMFEAYSKKERQAMFRAPKMISSIGKPLTKAEMIAVALNTGNEYNLKALMEGYQWAPSQVRDIIDRLDKRDMDMVQAIWDWIGEYKEPSFALEERLTGVRPTSVDPTPVTTPHGVYPGGYYPVKYDSRVNERTFKREAEVTTLDDFGGDFQHPATKKNRLIQRQGSGGQTVRLDLSVLNEHIAESIHDITHREAVIDTLRLIERKGIQDAIIKSTGREMYRQLRPWLADIAQEPKQPQTVLERVLSRLRGNVTIVSMGWKISTAIVQPLGLLAAVPRLGAGEIAGTVAKIYGRPDRIPLAMQFVMDRSAMMRHTAETWDRDARDALASIKGRRDGDPIPLAVRKNFFWMAGTMQMGVDLPVWMTAYDKARAGKADNISPTDEDAAIQYADSVVRMTQGSGSIKDQSRLLRQKGFMRLFTMFQTYFSTLYNQLYTEQMPGLSMGRIPFPVFFVNMVWLWFLPAYLGEALAGRGGPQPGESAEDTAKRLAGVGATYPLMGVIGVRDIAQGMVSPYGYEMSPVAAAMGAVTDVGQDALHGQMTEHTMKQAFMASGYWFGLPSRQLWTTFDYVKSVAGGSENPIDDPGSIWSHGAMAERPHHSR